MKGGDRDGGRIEREGGEREREEREKVIISLRPSVTSK